MPVLVETVTHHDYTVVEWKSEESILTNTIVTMATMKCRPRNSWERTLANVCPNLGKFLGPFKN